MLILLHSGVDFSRDIRVPVKKTCFIQELKFTRVVCQNEGEMPQRRVIEQEASVHESEAETEAVRSRSRADLCDSSLGVAFGVDELAIVLANQPNSDVEVAPENHGSFKERRKHSPSSIVGSRKKKKQETIQSFQNLKLKNAAATLRNIQKVS
ncbi:unnamed protein product [Cuscuta campestris]|uniref:Uncharacterized protein n=1 Tax=Cuscuta campestris TaxID=132261 RepID=A0A484NRM1_9ASTE|nr:unnamed protein product [Cuscuta campestris]